MIVMSSIQSQLAENPALKELSSEHLGILADCAHHVDFPTGKFLFWTEGSADRFYILQAGSVSLQVQPPYSKPILIGTVHSGDILGWSWLYPPYKWHFDAQATEPIEAIQLDARCVRQKCESDHELGYHLLRIFSKIMMDRLQATRLQLLDIYAKH